MGDPLRITRQFKTLLEGLRSGHESLASGLWGPAYAWLVAEIATASPGAVLLVLPTGDDADDAILDLQFFLPAGVVPTLFPAWETLPDENLPLHPDILGQRLSVLRRMLRPPESDYPAPRLVVTPIQALQQPVIAAAALAASFLDFRLRRDHSLEETARWLVDRGFERLPQVESPGQFSIRGGILDLFPLGEESPVRIEFSGDTVDSIRRFEPATQRSTQSLEEVRVMAVPDSQLRHLKPEGRGVTLLDHLPADTWVIIKEPAQALEQSGRFLESPAARKELYRFSELQAAWGRHPVLHLTGLPERARRHHAAFSVRSIERFTGRLESVASELAGLVGRNRRVVVVCRNAGELERLREIVAGSLLAAEPKLEGRIGTLTGGFEFDEAGTAFVTYREIFQRDRAALRPVRPRHPSAPLEDWLDLEPGNAVVHVVHGIGRYLGMERMERNGESTDFLALEFAEGTRIYVPASHIDLVQKYLGPTRGRPQLSKIGTLRWSRKKQEVKDAIEDMAVELLRIQAIRASQPGVRYPPDTEWQLEFEAAFPFEPTEDQRAAAEAIKRDMEQERPMDRLLCGDVGYGKTEVAMRAAFKTVLHGKQVAVLAPTTVLAQQHYRTFSERMADYPVTVEVVSRFRSKPEQKQILEQVQSGAVDILIGTHRLVQEDVRFHDLGLLVIDEEQRFGVVQKEFLKRMRHTVEVLTMTATPIPRTLHLSLLGIRDISALNTPPADRQSIHSEVCRFDPRLLRDAVHREMSRGGQVYFVHNRVQTIESMAARLAEIVPSARQVVAHGQMPEGELEACMMDFVNGRYDILVCTTIIGSGLDIPNANTIFLHEADRFGLAELHQLRGRVGRYKHRAYAYFLLPEDRPISPKALRRLKAIEEFSELGAGFKIALRDLEIRGAGNLLGPRQSGHIGAVGYELYCKLLDVTVRQLKNQPIAVPIDVQVRLGLDAFLPAAYVPDDRQKMEVYRDLARCHDLARIREVEEALADRYGPVPPPAAALLQQHRLRILAQPWEIHDIRRLPDRLELRSPKASEVAQALELPRPLIRHVDAHTVHVLFPSGLPESEIGRFAEELLGTRKARIPEGSAVVPPALLEGLKASHRSRP
ncbi:MAG: transcription-repair coupling factor [Planctomycetes bacterium]|nr:transcription-repair coupling factor [Planctomycetota bacterium]